jgi:hypothetical protein
MYGENKTTFLVKIIRKVGFIMGSRYGGKSVAFLESKLILIGLYFSNKIINKY